MKVLVACEFSGTVRDAFLTMGHDAVSCDLIESERPGPHVVGDALELAYGGQFDLMIAHPPCTFLTNSGVRWLYGGRGKVKDENRWQKMSDAAEFFVKLWRAPIAKKCLENPIPHSHAKLPPYSQVIQPWQFGHGETKATCLWLDNLPKLEPTRVVDGRKPRVHHASPGPDRWKERSRTYAGIASAFAQQWGAQYAEI